MAPSISSISKLPMFLAFALHLVWDHVDDHDGCDRDLDGAEFFTRTEELTESVRDKGMRFATFDYRTDENKNILSYGGFNVAVGIVMRIQERGLLWLRLPSCTFNKWETGLSGHSCLYK